MTENRSAWLYLGAVPLAIASTMQGGQIDEGSKIADGRGRLALNFHGRKEWTFAAIDSVTVAVPR
jgi:hypothetical protein